MIKSLKTYKSKAITGTILHVMYRNMHKKQTLKDRCPEECTTTIKLNKKNKYKH